MSFLKALGKSLFGGICGIFLGLYFLIFAITGVEPISSLIWGPKNRCDIDRSKEIAEVDFVGRKLYLPTKHIKDCYPLDMSTRYDYDPASISLIGIFPDFSVPSFKPDMYLSNEDEIRIHFRGSRQDIKEIDPGVWIRYINLDQQFENLSKGTIGKSRPQYQKPEKTDFGLLFYKTNATGAFAKDLYVSKDEAGNVEFMIECYNKDRKPALSIYYCSSTAFSLYDNVTFEYAFTLKHIADVKKIDRLAKSIVKSVIAKRD